MFRRNRIRPFFDKFTIFGSILANKRAFAVVFHHFLNEIVQILMKLVKILKKSAKRPFSSDFLGVECPRNSLKSSF